MCIYSHIYIYAHVYTPTHHGNQSLWEFIVHVTGAGITPGQSNPASTRTGGQDDGSMRTASFLKLE